MTMNLSSDNTVNALFVNLDPEVDSDREITQEEEYALALIEEEKEKSGP